MTLLLLEGIQGVFQHPANILRRRRTGIGMPMPARGSSPLLTDIARLLPFNSGSSETGRVPHPKGLLKNLRML